MALTAIFDTIVQQEWLDVPSKKVQEAVRNVYKASGPVGEWIKNFLHGSWLGHPLHPALTDVPIGAWTAALALDALEMSGGKQVVGAAADASIALGVGGSLAAAVAGVTDWHPLRGQRSRRVGAVHALLNTTAALLYGASLLMRRNGNRAAGRGLAVLGYAAVLGGAYLGGHLSYGLQIGVDHTADITRPEDWMPVLPEAELPEGELCGVRADGVPVLLYRQGERIYAMVETCSHLGGPLSEGHIEEGCVVCPWHASRFSLETGRVQGGPSAYSQPLFKVRVRDGQIEVKAGG